MEEHNVELIKIEEFWGAMAPLLECVLASPESNSLIDQIDNQVRNLGSYDWEYGPSSSADFYFCLSPNLQVDLIEEVDKIISMAPKLHGWEYISCKPRKVETLTWRMLNEKDEEINIDASRWECVVFKFPDNTVDLDVKINNVNGNSSIQYLAVDIHLTNILGERNFIRTIKSINIVEEFPEAERQRAISTSKLFEVLSKHIGGLDQ